MARLGRLASAQHGSVFRRNIIHVLRANVLTQVLAVVSMPLLSRLYSANDFGQFAFFSASVAIAVSFTTARFDWSIPNAGSAAAAAALYLLGFIATAVTSSGAFLLVGLSPQLVSTFFSDLGPWAWAIPVSMISLGLVELSNAWFVRGSNLRAVSVARIGQGLSNMLVSTLGGLSRLGTGGLMLALIAASWVNVILLARNAGQLWRHVRRITWRRVTVVLLRYWRQAALSTAVSVMNATSASITIILMAYWFSLEELGWYSLMLRLAIMPIGLVSSAIGQSFWARAAELARQHQFRELRSVYLRTTGRLALLSIPIITGCVLGPFIIGPIFGQEWAPAGYVLLATAPHLLGVAIFSPTNHLVVYGRQGAQLISDAIAIGLATFSIWLSAHWSLGIVVCTFYVSLSMLVGYLIRFFLHLRTNSELDLGV